MPATLFLQSDIQDPYGLYAGMLAENPVYWDEINHLWAIYSYKNCSAILTDKTAHIPPVNQNNKDRLSEHALLITGQLARLSNDAQHTIARETALLLSGNLKSISIPGIAKKLLQQQYAPGETDWVNAICKKLPVMVVLKSFDFNDAEADFISGKMEQLVKLMLPVKTNEQVKDINEMAKDIYTITERQLLATGILRSIIKTMQEKYTIAPDMVIAACTCNLIGLFIQGYDAGRGILSNAMIQVLNNHKTEQQGLADNVFLEQSVIETLRFDPPVQNTRRVAAENIVLDNTEIKKGDAILVVLAAANRDPQQFNHPDVYDTGRSNNNEHLSFGSGYHRCVASHFSVYLAVQTLSYFFGRYKIRLLEKKIEYEPAINLRLPQRIMIALG